MKLLMEFILLGANLRCHSSSPLPPSTTLIPDSADSICSGKLGTEHTASISHIFALAM